MLKIVKYIFCFERPGERGKPAADGVNYLFTVREAILENPAQFGAGQARAERGKLSYYCSRGNPRELFRELSCIRNSSRFARTVLVLLFEV